MSITNFTGVLSPEAISPDSLNNTVGAVYGQLNNSQLIVLDSKIKTTSIIVACYENLHSDFDESIAGLLIVDSIVDNTSYKIVSNNTNDNNYINIIIKY